MLMNRADAARLLERLGASRRLLLHLQLVSEASDILIKTYQSLGVRFDAKLIELGVALHDAGKILHPHELEGSGSLHEAAGETLLLAHGVAAEVARCCVTHAAWRGAEVSLEERTVALADTLWKGKRDAELELLVIDDVAKRLEVDRWAVFESLDSVFEEIAEDGSARLQRSKLA